MDKLLKRQCIRIESETQNKKFPREKKRTLMQKTENGIR